MTYVRHLARDDGELGKNSLHEEMNSNKPSTMSPYELSRMKLNDTRYTGSIQMIHAECQMSSHVQSPQVQSRSKLNDTRDMDSIYMICAEHQVTETQETNQNKLHVISPYVQLKTRLQRTRNETVYTDPSNVNVDSHTVQTRLWCTYTQV